MTYLLRCCCPYCHTWQTHELTEYPKVCVSCWYDIPLNWEQVIILQEAKKQRRMDFVVFVTVIAVVFLGMLELGIL